MLNDVIRFLADTIFGLFSLAALTRFYMQALRVPMRNPIGQFVMALTDFLVKPLRRMLPGLKGFDTASFVAAWVAQILLVLLLAFVAGLAIGAIVNGLAVIIGLALIKVLKLSLYLLIGVTIVQAIMSWVNPYHPLAGVFGAMVAPFLNPIRRVLPTIGGIDLSPLVLIIICQIVLMAPIAWIESEAWRVLRVVAR